MFALLCLDGSCSVIEESQRVSGLELSSLNWEKYPKFGFSVVSFNPGLLQVSPFVCFS